MPSDAKTAPTMEDVAHVAGCHSSTVSLALRGDERITRATRERVVAAAQRLGYRINPMVAAWVSARRAGRPAARHVPLAYLTCHPGSFRWQADAHFRSIYDGAHERAEQYGFALTEFRLSDYPPDLVRLNQVLVTRNIQGIIIGPTLAHHELRGLDWKRYALATIGYGLSHPAVHRVTEDHHLGMKLAFEACLAKGHRRIGLALVRQHNPMRRERWIGAYLYEQHQHLPAGRRLPVHVATPPPSMAAVGWLKKHRPDIVLSDDPAAWHATGVTTMGFALSEGHDVQGVHENNQGIGRSVADLLIGLVLRNERGIPAGCQTVMVEPILARQE